MSFVSNGKVADRVVAASLENSRTNRSVNLMGLVFFKNVFITLRTSVQNECMFLKFFSFTFVKIKQYFRPRPLE